MSLNTSSGNLLLSLFFSAGYVLTAGLSPREAYITPRLAYLLALSIIKECFSMFFVTTFLSKLPNEETKTEKE